MIEVKERVFPNIAGFCDPFSFLNFIREQYRKPSPLIRFCLFLRLNDLEIVYPDDKEE